MELADDGMQLTALRAAADADRWNERAVAQLATNLAERLGCWYQSVASWERGESEPLAARWRAIEAALGPGLVPERDGLPERIQAARLRLGQTQEELTRRARWTRGRYRMPSAGTTLRAGSRCGGFA